MSNHSTNIKIYTFYYKKSPIIISDESYIPVMAGNALTVPEKEFIGDDCGLNISNKNKAYSELTGIYWVWKNTQQDIVGSCHYRRYFYGKEEPKLFQLKRYLYFFAGLYKKRYGLIYSDNLSRFLSDILSPDEIKKLLDDYDVILPTKRKLRYSVKEHYCRYHNAKDLEIIHNILQEKYPEYLPSFYAVMNQNRLYANNMFVFRNDRFQECAEWWFDMLFEFEKHVDLNTYNGYQERIMGFIAERLFNVWLHKHDLNIKEFPIVYFKNLKRA